MAGLEHRNVGTGTVETVPAMTPPIVSATKHLTFYVARGSKPESLLSQRRANNSVIAPFFASIFLFHLFDFNNLFFAQICLSRTCV